MTDSIVEFVCDANVNSRAEANTGNGKFYKFLVTKIFGPREHACYVGAAA